MKKIVMYWRDIPSMITIKRGREKGKIMLADRFQEAIDRAAMRAGKGGSDLYIEEWRSDASEFQTDLSLQDAAAQEARQIEALFDNDLLKRMVKNNGVNVVGDLSNVWQKPTDCNGHKNALE